MHEHPLSSHWLCHVWLPYNDQLQRLRPLPFSDSQMEWLELKSVSGYPFLAQSDLSRWLEKIFIVAGYPFPPKVDMYVDNFNFSWPSAFNAGHSYYFQVDLPPLSSSSHATCISPHFLARLRMAHSYYSVQVSNLYYEVISHMSFLDEPLHCRRSIIAMGSNFLPLSLPRAISRQGHQANHRP
jgi:hypothetical protein